MCIRDRQRSLHSSPRWGKPATWRRETGGLTTETSRYARCETPKRFWELSANVADNRPGQGGFSPCPGRLSATFADNSQNRFGVSHLAYLDVSVVRPPVSLRHVAGFPHLGLLW